MTAQRVLFVFFTDPRRAFSSSVAALSAVVSAAGHEPEALEVFREYSIEDVAAHIDALNPDVLAMSCMTRDWPGAHALVDRLKTDTLVLVGGYHASLAPLEVAECEGVDAICIGEGERPVTRLLDLLSRGEPLQTFEGLWVRSSNTGWEGDPPQADPEPDIAALPPWDYEVFGSVPDAIEAGINTFGPLIDEYLPTRAGRGCPFTCAYCSAPRWGKLGRYSESSRRNTRPVTHLCAELASLRDRYQPEGFEFWDEHFPIDLKWLEEFAEVYPKMVGLPFKVEMHPNAATRPRLALLKKAGCSLFHCGIEAGDEAFRRGVLNRRTTDARLAAVFDDCRELDLETSASLMTMLPGETREQMKATTDLLHRLKPGSFMWSNFHPLPGTVLGEAGVEHWPMPARATFSDYDQVKTSMPPAVNAQERAETFAELGALQHQLVQIAAKRAGKEGGRPRARPIEVPVPMSPPSEALIRTLALPSPARPLAAAFDKGVLSVQVEHPAMGEKVIRFAPLEGHSHFVRARGFGLSYGGKEAPDTLLAMLRELAERLGGTSLEALETAYRDA
ncbi:MAG: anaerobic magnesium-protoporphyrin IX monomethyl ester cyclase [Polyangiales bacterium]|jgi:anaerobic magnesium-protoporphyrin IX monomethyl ester cyclase